METIRFTEPLKRTSADWRTTPYDLHNAYLDRNTSSVKAVLGGTPVQQYGSELNFGPKPYFVWNGRLLTGATGTPGENSVIAGDSFNSVLYVSESEVSPGRGIVAYPAAWDNSTVQDEAYPPYIVSIGNDHDYVAEWTIYEPVTSTPLYTHVAYLVIPFNERDEAGPWAYYPSRAKNYKMGKTLDEKYWYTRYGGEISYRQDLVWVERVQQRLNIVSQGASYIEVYRTVEQADIVGFENDITFYFLGRFQISNNGVEVFDDKMWWLPNWQSMVFMGNPTSIIGGTSAGDPDITNLTEFPATPEMLIETGARSPERLVLPSKVLSRSINAYSQPGPWTLTGPTAAGTLDLAFVNTDPTSGMAYGVPATISARSILNQAGIMAYGNVAWPTKIPAVIAALPGSDTIKLAYEYRVNDNSGANADGRTIYGPTLTLQNVEKVQIAWQGEQALLVMDSTGHLIERLVPDALGRYSKAYTPQFAIKLFGGQAEAAALRIQTHWTYDGGLNANTPTPAVSVFDLGTQPTHIYEPNVVLLSENNRPREITFEQFFMPDDMPVRTVSAARLMESEQLREYRGYVMTEKSIFWFNIDPPTRQITFDYLTSVVGVKHSAAAGAMSTLVHGGVVIAGTDDNLYALSGRSIERIDLDVDGLWSTVYDLAYDTNTGDLYVMTDTGIWAYNFNFFQGIYKHIDYTPDSTSTLSFFDTTISHPLSSPFSTTIRGVVAYTNDVATLLESGNQATDASVTTHKIRAGQRPVRIASLTCLGDLGLHAAKVNMTTSTQVDIQAPSELTFTADDIGRQILVDAAATGGVAYIGRITARTTTQATVTPASDLTPSGVTAAWPIYDVTHDAVFGKQYSDTFNFLAGRQYFPRKHGIQHSLTVAKFGEFYGFEVLFEEV